MRLSHLVLPLFALALTVTAHAESITQSFESEAQYSAGLGGGGGYAVNPFDHSLGTLTSIGVTYSGTYTVTPGDVFITSLNFYFFPDLDQETVTGTGVLETAAPQSDSTTLFQELNYVTDTTDYSLTSGYLFLYLNAHGTTGIYTTPGYHIDLTYNYTPTPPPPSITPEPSSFALLGTGVFGVIGAGKRRRSA